MNLYRTPSLFAWDRLEDSPDLRVVRDFFRLLPDAPLLQALEQARGKGRDDYPIRVLWFCALLQPLLRHPTMEQMPAEPPRNSDLRALGGMDDAGLAPKPWNMRRFLDTPGREPFRGRKECLNARRS